jgi:hypothetical protein
MKLKSKSNIKPAVAHAAGTPTRAQIKNRRPAQGSTKIKSKANIKLAAAHVADEKAPASFIAAPNEYYPALAN